VRPTAIRGDVELEPGGDGGQDGMSRRGWDGRGLAAAGSRCRVCKWSLQQARQPDLQKDSGRSGLSAVGDVDWVDAASRRDARFPDRGLRGRGEGADRRGRSVVQWQRGAVEQQQASHHHESQSQSQKPAPEAASRRASTAASDYVAWPPRARSRAARNSRRAAMADARLARSSEQMGCSVTDRRRRTAAGHQPESPARGSARQRGE